MSIKNIQQNIFLSLRFIFVTLVCVVGFALYTYAAPNPQINYQGKLTDAGGVAVTDGDYSIQFSLYTDASGGSNIWTETNTVTITNGLFSIMLGSSTPLTSVNFSQILYLALNVEADGEMVPRKILGTVPSAFEADKLDTIDSTSFLRSDVDDTATGLLTFTGGFISNGSTTITTLSILNATTTTLHINGSLYDSTNSAGTSGYVLQSTGTGQQWVATSTLGIGGGSSFTTSAELAAILSDETGSGSAVFSVSPAFTGTIDAAAATLSSTLTLSGTAANIALGSNYLSGDGGDEGIYVDGSGNVGVGTTTLSSALTISGTTTQAGNITFPFGGDRIISVEKSNLDSLVGDDLTIKAGDGYLNSTNTNGGELHLRGGDCNGFVCLGGNVVIDGGWNSQEDYASDVILATQSSGQVGIGDSTPSQKLDIDGTNAQILIEESTTEFLRVGVGETSSTSIIGWDDADSLQLGVYSSPTDTTIDSKLTILSSGSIGIGTTTPSQRLTVAGNMHLTGSLYDSLNSAGTAGQILRSTGSGVEWVASTTVGSAFNTSAELAAILTDETGTGLSVFSTSPAFSGTATFSALTATSTLTMSGTAANIALGSNYLSGDGGDEGVFVDSVGKVGIGTTTPGSLLTLQSVGNAASINTDFSFVDVDGLTRSALSSDGIQRWYVGTNRAQIGFATPSGDPGIRISTDSDAENRFNLVNAGAYFSIYPNSIGMGNSLNIASTTGYIGIGTTTPSQKLTVEGNAYIAGNLTTTGTVAFNGPITVGSGTGTSTFNGNIGITGNITPSADNTYSLGSPSYMWKDVYIGPGSLYINGKKVIEDISDTITFSTDADQNLVSQTSGIGSNTLRATGTGNVVLTTDSGNINLTSTSGNVNIGTTGSGQLNLGTVTSGVWNGTAIANNYLANSAITINGQAISLGGSVTLTAASSTLLSDNNTWSGTNTYSSNLTLSGTSANVILGSNYLSGDGGDEGVFVDSAGLVGIGTATPDQRLTVKGNINIGTGTYLKIRPHPSYTGMKFDYNIGGGGYLSLIPVDGSDVDQSAVMTVKYGGNVGIGTSTTPVRLAIQTSATTDILNLFETGGTEVFTVLESGNVGVGVTSPTSLLDVNGVTTIRSRGANLPHTDSIATGLRLFNGQTDVTGDGSRLLFDHSFTTPGATSPERGAAIWSVSGATWSTDVGLALGTNADSSSGITEKVRILGNGNVGIGTSTPTSLAGVEKILNIAGTSAGIRFEDTDASDFELYTAGDKLKLWGETAGGDILTVLSTGNVGIGTTTPATTLSIAGNTYLTGGLGVGVVNTNPNDIALGVGGQVDFADEVGDKLYLYSTSYGLGISSAEANWWSGGAWSWRNTSRTGNEVMNLSSAGNLQMDGILTVSGTGDSYFAGDVGIGDTTPDAKLDVEATSGSALKVGNTTSTFFDIDAATGVSSFGNSAGTGDAIFQIAGNSNAWSLGYRSSDKSFNIASSTNFTGVSALSIAKNGNTTIVGSAVTCTIGNGSSATNCSSSDERLKNDVMTLSGTSTLALLGQLHPVSFNWNEWMQENGSTNQIQYGLIAQEVQNILPSLVSVDEHTGYYKLDYQNLIAPAIAGIQELNTRTAGLSSATTTPQLFVTGNGNVGVGIASPTYKLQVQGDVAATAFVNVSTRDAKTDIMYFDAVREDEVLTHIRDIKIAEYHYKSENNTDQLRLGLIAEEAPSEVLSLSGKGVDIYKLATFTLAGVKAQQRQIDAMQTSIDDLQLAFDGLLGSTTAETTGENKLLASILGWFEDLGIFINDSVAHFNNLAATAFTVGSEENPNGITLYDKSTGEAYCVEVENGEIRHSQGECQTIDDTANDKLPTIHLVGNAIAQVALNSTYSDLGARAQATREDGQHVDINYAVYVNGEEKQHVEIDTTTSGVYYIDYVAEYNEEEAIATRTVIVGDAEEPEERPEETFRVESHDVNDGELSDEPAVVSDANQAPTDQSADEVGSGDVTDVTDDGGTDDVNDDATTDETTDDTTTDGVGSDDVNGDDTNGVDDGSGIVNDETTTDTDSDQPTADSQKPVTASEQPSANSGTEVGSDTSGVNGETNENTANEYEH